MCRYAACAISAASVPLLVLVSSGDAAAEGRDSGTPIPRITDAGADTSTVISRTPPDPPAMSERMQWVFDLRYDRGDVYLLEVHKVDMGAPHVTPRVMGRFALELFEGPTLIERVRFDFPMLGPPEVADAGPPTMKSPPRFEPKLRTRIGVLFPATKRGTKLELWDRAKDIRMAIAWPPVEGTAVPDAGPQARP